MYVTCYGTCYGTKGKFVHEILETRPDDANEKIILNAQDIRLVNYMHKKLKR